MNGFESVLHFFSTDDVGSLEVSQMKPDTYRIMS